MCCQIISPEHGVSAETLPEVALAALFSDSLRPSNEMKQQFQLLRKTNASPSKIPRLKTFLIFLLLLFSENTHLLCSAMLYNSYRLCIIFAFVDRTVVAIMCTLHQFPLITPAFRHDSHMLLSSTAA